jgi:hypothetical protein
VRGALSFGTADIARALHCLGFIDAVWPPVPRGTLEAMAGAWSSAHEAKCPGVGPEETTRHRRHDLSRQAAVEDEQERARRHHLGRSRTVARQWLHVFADAANGAALLLGPGC